MLYLLHANTCIAAMRGHPLVVRRLAAAPPRSCAISAITRYELFVGVEKSADPAKEKTKVDQLLNAYRRLRFGAAAAEQAARIRAYLESLGTPIGPYDTLLAGHALSLSLIVVKANIKKFSRVPGLTVENWQLWQLTVRDSAVAVPSFCNPGGR